MRSIAKVILASAAAAILLASADERARIASAALTQVGVTKLYDSSYAQLRYPGGDVPVERGVCADVVVRAFRAIGADLQLLVHEDMRKNFRAYPQMWGLRHADANIDHRRVPNLMRFFERRGKAVAIAGAYEPGDVVAWMLPNGLYHIGVVSPSTTPGGTHLVVHNIGDGAQNEDVLHAWRIIGHYRW